MIPLPSFLATPLRAILGLLTLVALGAGGVFAWKYFRDREEKAAVESIPAVAENKRAIDTATATNVIRAAEYHSAVGGFTRAAAIARSNPSTQPETRACYEAGLSVISRCDSLHKSDSTLIALYAKRDTLLTDVAVRARRGRLLQVTAAGGYDPFWGAPAARVGIEINFSDHWSLIGTGDQAFKFSREFSTQTRRSGLIGLNYRFGGRN
jgi:hypothetical protein